ncbi:MAG: hypothetical protein JWP11_41 [Frankiales bacterium]|nr:hypothetical protein [Frankiales bacterium]
MTALVATRAIEQLVVRGKRVQGNLADRITTAHVSLSAPLKGGAYSVSQLTFTVHDPDLVVWNSHLFDLGATVDLGSLYCRVAEVELLEPETGAEISVIARSEGSEKLANERGYQTWANLSLGDVAVQLGERAGLKVVIATPLPALALIYRKEPDVTVPGDRGESSWDMLARYAKAHGCVVFEAYGVAYVGKPSDLVKKLHQVRLAWDPKRPPDDLLEMPRCRRTQDGFGRDVREVTFRVTAAVAARLTPGMSVALSGIERFSTTYLISGVEFDVEDGAQGTVTAALPTDPVISPTDAAAVAETVHTATGPNQGGSDFGRFVNAISDQETGGVYGSVNARTGALGRYQVMPSNVGPWSKKALGRTVTTSEFLHNPALQDQIAVGVLWTYYSVHGARGAAAAWYSGDPLRQNDNSHNPAAPNEPSVAEYCDQVVAKMAGASGVLPAGYTGAGSSSGPTVVSGPKKSAALFVATAQSQVTDHTPYVYGAKAAASVDDPQALDCSGLTTWAAARAGIKLPDGALNQQEFCASHGTGITVDKAFHIVGALVFRVGLGGTDHVAISMGDGKHTIEAMGRAYGVVDGPISGRGWNSAGLVPGLSYP